MSASLPRYLPDSEAIKKCVIDALVGNREVLISIPDPDRKRPVIETIAAFVGSRLAEKVIIEEPLRRDVAHLINGLQAGEDSRTGETLPHLGNLGLTSIDWRLMARDVVKALMNCAQENS